ncbi:MAG TPA: hypothetical protein VGP68_15855 [Gemmataceae bacterium]|nr:hypothetical protein [Gemmataceae bacterium]
MFSSLHFYFGHFAVHVTISNSRVSLDAVRDFYRSYLQRREPSTDREHDSTNERPPGGLTRDDGGDE